MLRSANDLRGYQIVATDGEIGSVDDFYFDDEAWTVRYLVVDTGKWLPDRRVLVSPIAINPADSVARTLPVSLTRTQVKSSPGIEKDLPVSQQQEIEFSRYYGYPYYWSGAALWGPAPYPAGALAATPGFTGPPADVEPAHGDRHLRSCREVTGYHLRATDGELGHVEDLLLDDLDWAIRYIVVDTRNWWFGQKVVIVPEWMNSIDWAQREVRVDVTRDEVKSAPPYDEVTHVNRQWETDYYAHHKQPPYWISDVQARRIKARQP